MIVTIVWMIIIVCLAWLTFWVLVQFEPPPPIGKVVRVVIVVVTVLVLLGFLASIFGIDTGLPKVPVS